VTYFFSNYFEEKVEGFFYLTSFPPPRGVRIRLYLEIDLFSVPFSRDSRTFFFHFSGRGSFFSLRSRVEKRALLFLRGTIPIFLSLTAHRRPADCSRDHLLLQTLPKRKKSVLLFFLLPP